VGHISGIGSVTTSSPVSAFHNRVGPLPPVTINSLPLGEKARPRAN
jgi:hypothetical protein